MVEFTRDMGMLPCEKGSSRNVIHTTTGRKEVLERKWQGVMVGWTGDRYVTGSLDVCILIWCLVVEERKHLSNGEANLFFSMMM